MECLSLFTTVHWATFLLCFHPTHDRLKGKTMTPYLGQTPCRACHTNASQSCPCRWHRQHCWTCRGTVSFPAAPQCRPPAASGVSSWSVTSIGSFQKATKNSFISFTLPALMTLICILWRYLVLNCSVYNCIFTH